MSQTQNQNQSRRNLAQVLWKVKDALHNIVSEGVCVWHCRKGDFAMTISKSKIVKTSCVVKKTPISKDWNVKFGVEVHQMLQVASMEVKASKIQVDHGVKEKQ
jgi:hypothetical protein